jgi:LDH2 family malate/lactate/ureidoglycolate dehydrogenase
VKLVLLLSLRRNSTHFGSCAPFLEEVVNRGFICMVGSNSTQSMAVFDAPRANLGNMPFGFAAPVKDGPDFLFDFCCAVMSFGKLNRFKAAGKEIPEDAFKKNEVQDEDALYTNASAIENLALPFGGFKGGNIALMVEMLSGLLSFGHFGTETEVVRDSPEGGRKLQGPSHFVMAIDPSKFGTETDYSAHMKSYLAELKASHEEIAYAGERANAIKVERQRDGIPIPDEVRAEVDALAETKGATLDWVL